MKINIRRILILFIVFILGLVGTTFLLNGRETDNRSDMKDAVLPEVMVQIGDTLCNLMNGYKQPMQTDYLRDSLTPIDKTKKLKLVVDAYDAEVNSLSYEVRTSDGSKVLENKKMKNLKAEEEYLTTEIEISSDLRINQEYSLQISLETSEGEIYYYTRIVSRSQLNTEEYLKFVNTFAEKCLDKTAAEDLTSYLEPISTGSATNYSEININSTFSEISWGSMKPELYRKGIPTINEINGTTASISLEYQITSEDNIGTLELYDVTEFYRMRYTETRTRLLDFERTAKQVFIPNATIFSDEGVVLGIREKNVEYMSSDDQSITAFVQQGELWSFSPENDKITKVFSFRKDSESDSRDSRQKHDIKILRVLDNGDIDFVLYGYMNRGAYEGHCGVCVYHYNNNKNLVEELAFIPENESYEFLKKDLETLSYISEDNQLFLIFSENLYRISLEEHIYEVLEKGIMPENLAVSDTNAHAAWLVTEGDHAGSIRMIDFNTKNTRVFNPQEGQQIRVIGFLNEDLVYGILMNEDILVDENHHVSEGYHTLKIQGFDGEVKKEYHQDNLYVTNISFGGTLMEFDLCKKSGNEYTYQKKDNIMNNKKAATNEVSVNTFNESRTGVQVRLTYAHATGVKDPLVLYAKVQSTQENQILIEKEKNEEALYFVYARGKLDGIFKEPAKAVQRADERTGVVLNQGQQYIWERGNKKTSIKLNESDILDVIKSGMWDKKALQDSLNGQGTVIDLSGCTLDQVLYEVSAQRPVIAKTGENSCVIIVGYDEYNTYLYYPNEKEIKPYGLNDSTELFQKEGNIFISYIENVAY